MARLIETVRGDTFDALALEFYDNEKLACEIIKANPDYCDTVVFDAGVELLIPDITDAALPETLPPWRR